MKLIAENMGRQYFRKTKNSNVFWAVKNVNLSLETGKLVEITGRSGSGKSTVLNMMCGLLTPSAGTVRTEDTDLYAMADAERSRFRNRYFGIIPQGQTGLSALTVLENVLLPCRMYGAEGDQEKAVELLEHVGIAALRDVFPAELSGGEMRRLAIARALMMDPAFILADEPTGDLDDENTHAVLRLLRSAADTGKSVLLVTHEREAAAYADTVYRMDGGSLL